MIQAESISLPNRPMTYAEAGAILGKSEKFIRQRVRDGSLVGLDLGYNCKRVAPLEFLKYLEARKTVENRPR